MQRRHFTLGLSALACGLSLPALAQSSNGYIQLKTPVATSLPKGQIEVIEFFSYGCVHCMNFEPIFQAWKKTQPKDVVVTMVHVGFSKSFEPLQKLFYALQTINALDSTHNKVFTAVQKERIRLDSPDVLFNWIAQQGLDRAKFEAAYNSFGAASSVRRAIQLQEAYQVEGTPALGIAGRYYTDGSLAKGFERMVQITNQLIAQQRQAA